MIVEFKDYTIEISNDSNYTLNSADNRVTYKFEYFDGREGEDMVYPSSKHGIRVKQNGVEISSAIITEIGGATTVHDKSFVLKKQSLFICCSDKVYSLTLPDLLIDWSKRLDPATCFGIYELEDDLIIHGELEITRIDEDGNIKWQFGARDIFISGEGRNDFTIANNEIIVRDWEGYQYRLNREGKVIEEVKK